jgi:acyl transferase domain-containing protein
MTSVLDEYRARLRRSLAQLKDMENELEAAHAERTEPIAVIGMACRFPGNANSPNAFFQILEDEVDAVTEVPSDRWSLPPSDTSANNDERAKRWGAFVRDIDMFDASFFGISPREASAMDPQQRLVLELSWEALERAGQSPAELAGSNTGVFIGITQNDYLLNTLMHRSIDTFDFYDIVGNGHCLVAGRISYTLGLEGPSMAIDTACSSSLVAIHLACQSLRLRESDIALAGGVHLMLARAMTDLIATTHGISPDGRCKTFDAGANGFVRGEGSGMVVLKRLSDAQRDGDPIVAIIRGSAINQDGRSAGIAAPNVKAQEAVLLRALASARLQPQDIGYIEMHGTGTPLGDPIEAAALRLVLGKPRSDGTTCVLGAAKTNIAHIEAARWRCGFHKGCAVPQA